MTRYIPVQVDEEYAICDSDVIGAERSHDDVFLRLEFSNFWSGLVKYCIWRNSKGQNPTTVAVTSSMLVDGSDNTYDVPVPVEAKEFAGLATMTIKGVAVSGGSETRRSDTKAHGFKVLPSVDDAEAEEAAAVTPEMADQIRAEIEALSDISLKYMGNITSSTVFADLEDGIYRVNGVSHADFPTSANYYGSVIILAGIRKTMMLVAGVNNSNGFYVRRYFTGSGTWSSWVRCVTNTEMDSKQDVIADLATIRSGAAAGATAYQKPGTGIPKTDLASNVQTTLSNADSHIANSSIHHTVRKVTESLGPGQGTITYVDQVDGSFLSAKYDENGDVIDMSSKAPNLGSAIEALLAQDVNIIYGNFSAQDVIDALYRAKTYEPEWEDVENKPFETLSEDDFEVSGGVLKTKGGGGGTSDHSQLTNRDAENQHPISAITGLQTELDRKSEFSGSYNDLTNKPTIPDELADLTEDTTHRTVTDTQINTWNSKATSASVTAVSNRVTAIEDKEAGWDAKYDKPSTGIPASDLAPGVIPETEEADELPVVTAIGATPSNSNVPTEKAVADAITAAIGDAIGGAY